MKFVTRDEAEYIKAHSDSISIAITSKKKKAKRKKHYCEEGGRTTALLRQYYEELKQKNKK